MSDERRFTQNVISTKVKNSDKLQKINTLQNIITVDSILGPILNGIYEVRKTSL